MGVKVPVAMGVQELEGVGVEVEVKTGVGL